MEGKILLKDQLFNKNSVKKIAAKIKHVYPEFTIIEPYVHNVVDIVNFIESKFEGREFYHQMFFNHPKRLPDELIFNILNRLSLKDAMSVSLVSKE